jgi:decaprenylphospho-beta-D-erythro-pentofuranosid-2-ulose 2-reductase
MTPSGTSSPSFAGGLISSRATTARSCVVVGGSSGVGRALVSQLAARGDAVLAVARDRRDLAALQSDCLIRLDAHIRIVGADLAASDFDVAAFVKRCVDDLGHISHVFMPLGLIHADDCGLPSAEVLESLAVVNYLRPAQLLSAFCQYFSTIGHGNAMVFTSIATDAPRGRNAAYGSAKKALEFYCRALQHHFADTKISIQICALGYVDTTMSFGAKLLFPAASPEEVAQFALRLCRTGTRFSYFPRFWLPIIMLLEALPWSLYKKLRF